MAQRIPANISTLIQLSQETTESQKNEHSNVRIGTNCVSVQCGTKGVKPVTQKQHSKIHKKGNSRGDTILVVKRRDLSARAELDIIRKFKKIDECFNFGDPTNDVGVV
ncbi:hypothetical protein VNO78_23051 [Psophocarpus tetragonolobus]|uniref:Uncharacterized protein n=1 Tax=Psophocarpus tetragonolobus TaxID=3891 RepID=A0AAN9S2L3_PSOTE